MAGNARYGKLLFLCGMRKGGSFISNFRPYVPLYTQLFTREYHCSLTLCKDKPNHRSSTSSPATSSDDKLVSRRNKKDDHDDDENDENEQNRKKMKTESDLEKLKLERKERQEKKKKHRLEQIEKTNNLKKSKEGKGQKKNSKVVDDSDSDED